MNPAEARVEVGRVVAVHGVRGGLKLESWTDPRTRIFSYRHWTLVLPSGEERGFGAADGAAHGQGLLARLPGVDDRDQALAMVGARIFVPRTALPKPAPGEYYWTDLEGLSVTNMDGVAFGRVDHLLATGANDVLVVVDAGGRQRLVPFVPDMYVREVDLEAGTMRVDWDPEF